MNKLLSASLVFVVAGGLLQATPIDDLFNTGVGSSGTPLSSGILDSHYAVVASPVGPTSAVTGVLAGTWLGADPDSQWIYAQGGPDAVGPIDFQTTFTLPADFSIASISGQFATDNEMVDVYLNGESLGISQANPFGFTFWTAFSIPSGSDFVGGLNTLDFVINNDGGPEGLRVEMTGDVSAGSTVPDSGSTVLLLLGGVILVGCCARRILPVS